MAQPAPTRATGVEFRTLDGRFRTLVHAKPEMMQPGFWALERGPQHIEISEVPMPDPNWPTEFSYESISDPLGRAQNFYAHPRRRGVKHDMRISGRQHGMPMQGRMIWRDGYLFDCRVMNRKNDANHAFDLVLFNSMTATADLTPTPEPQAEATPPIRPVEWGTPLRVGLSVLLFLAVVATMWKKR